MDAPRYINLYKSVANNHLNDYELIHQLQLENWKPNDPEARAKWLENIESKIKQIKTQGRVPFQFKTMIEQLKNN